MMPSLCGLCQYCYKISRIVKVTNPERCLEILEKNIICPIVLEPPKIITKQTYIKPS